jgi:RNA polymerase sigma-70 factor, ECF subfamily
MTRLLPKCFATSLERCSATVRPRKTSLKRHSPLVIAARSGRPAALTMPWVMGVARHKLVDHYRRAARDERRLALAWAQAPDSVELEAVDNADPARVLEMMCRLSPEHRLVLVLKYVDELAVQEIATTLHRSLHATNSLLSRARRALATSVAGSTS